MIPTADELPAIAALIADTPDDAANRLARLVECHGSDAARLRVARDASGAPVAFVRVFTPAPDAYWITAPRCRVGAGDGAEEAAAALLDEVMALADARGWRRLSTRVDPAASPAGYRAALEGHGFVAVNARVEYEAPVDRLPPEEDSPFAWVPLDTFGRDAAAALIDAAGPGPEWEDDDTGAAVLAHALGRRDMYHAPDCVQIGLIEGEPAAFVIAQVEPASGWSTITFMGLTPAHRGRGLGRHVHRRGMALLRAQGGSVYRGGTSETNQPMIRLFERHGCQLCARLVEYVVER